MYMQNQTHRVKVSDSECVTGWCCAVQVGEGKVKELAAEAAQATTPLGDEAAKSSQEAATAARHALEEARMLQLLSQRAAMLEAAKVRTFEKSSREKYRAKIMRWGRCACCSCCRSTSRCTKPPRCEVLRMLLRNALATALQIVSALV